MAWCWQTFAHVNSDMRVKKVPPCMNSSFIIKLIFRNQDGAIKSKSKELEKREITKLPCICFSLQNSSYSRVGKGVITADLCLLPLPKESQDFGPQQQVARTSHRLLWTSHRLLSTDRDLTLLLRFYNANKYGTVTSLLKMFIFADIPDMLWDISMPR